MGTKEALSNPINLNLEFLPLDWHSSIAVDCLLVTAA